MSGTAPHVCLDVHYEGGQAHVGAVVFQDWSDASPLLTLRLSLPTPAAYVPGEFYKRELPCLLSMLQALPDKPQTVVIDGYVWLGPERPGLGARLHDALHDGTAVIGVAKTRFQSQANALEVRRGESERPLFITSAGLEPEAAAQCIASMTGEFRMPFLLKLADQLCRGRVPAQRCVQVDSGG